MKLRHYLTILGFLGGLALAATPVSAHCGTCGAGDKEKHACPADCQKECCKDKKTCPADCQKECCKDKKEACPADCQKECCKKKDS